MSCKQLPKVELHLHLEGAASAKVIGEIASKKGAVCPVPLTDSGNYSWNDFKSFLSIYEKATSILQSPEDYAFLTRKVLQESARHSVIYSEIFLAPDLIGDDLSQWKEIYAAIDEEASRACDSLNIEVRFILTAVRHFGPKKSERVAKLASQVGGRVTGFGLAGDETCYDLKDFKRAFSIAEEAGMGLTCHAGEICGKEAVFKALDLNITRIGHGVNAHSDYKLLQQIIEKEILLEICPSSNVALGVVSDFKSHPVDKLRLMGVPLSISTDDPPYFSTNISEEYDKLKQTFCWDDGILHELNINSMNWAFCDSNTRNKIKNHLKSFKEKKNK